MTASFSNGAIVKALETFWKKKARDTSGACSTSALTRAINSQAHLSCNMTGFQAVADAVNRDSASGEGLMPSRTRIQQCGDDIATGAKTVVTPTIDEDFRCYSVNIIDELISITNLAFIRQEQKLSKDIIRENLDAAYNGKWKHCIVKIDTKNKILMALLKAKAIDLNFSVDGFRLAAAANGGVGFILTFKGKEVLRFLNKDYDEQKDNPEYGDRAGIQCLYFFLKYNTS